MNCVTRIHRVEKFFYNPNVKQPELVVYGGKDCRKCPHLTCNPLNLTNYKCRGILDAYIPVQFGFFKE